VLGEGGGALLLEGGDPGRVDRHGVGLGLFGFSTPFERRCFF
jgi:hypothetical protein